MPNEVKAPTIQAAADHLGDGEKLAIAGENTLFSKQTVAFTAQIDGELDSDATITHFPLSHKYIILETVYFYSLENKEALQTYVRKASLFSLRFL